MSEKHEFMTPDELAELLRTTRKALYCRIHRDELPRAAIYRRCAKGHLLFRRPVIERWLKGGVR
jgi:hypothetical protein